MFQGMDVSWVRHKAVILQTLGAEVKTLQTLILAIRDESMIVTNWDGDDKKKFVSDYDLVAEPALKKTNEMLVGLGQNFSTNANGQAAVSSVRA